MLNELQIKKLTELGYKRTFDYGREDLWAKGYGFRGVNYVFGDDRTNFPIECKDIEEYKRDLEELAKVGIK